MARFRCFDCNKKVSTRAGSCPKCGNTNFCKEIAEVNKGGRDTKIFLNFQNGDLTTDDGRLLNNMDSFCSSEFIGAQLYVVISPENGLITEDDFRWKHKYGGIYTWREMIERYYN